MSLLGKQLLVGSLLIVSLCQLHSVQSIRPPMCGQRLTRMLKVVCAEVLSSSQHHHLIKRKAEAIATVIQKSLPADWKTAMKQDRTDGRMDLMERCCFKGCSMEELKSFCPL